MEVDLGGAQILAVEGPDDIRERTVPVELHGRRAGRAAVCVPNRASSAVRRSDSALSSGTTSTVGRPISALSFAGVPSATMCPWSMIPTRSASTSASSRYCVVRKTVTPSSRANRPTSSQSAVRLCGSRPVVGSSRKRIDGPWISESARSSRRFMPPEYVRILRSPADMSPTRASRRSISSTVLRRESRAARPAAGGARARSGTDRAPSPGVRRRSWRAPSGRRGRRRTRDGRAARGGRE